MCRSRQSARRLGWKEGGGNDECCQNSQLLERDHSRPPALIWCNEATILVVGQEASMNRESKIPGFEIKGGPFVPVALTWSDPCTISGDKR